jgi:hypothetical protein
MNWGTALGGALQTGGNAATLMDMYNKSQAPNIQYQYGNSLNTNLPTYLKTNVDSGSSSALSGYA